MQTRTLGSWIAALALLMATGACGGGGSSGFRGATPTLSFSSTLLPQLASGQATEYALPIEGGCGGPYTIRVIAGALPDGVAVDDRQAHIEGPGVPAAHRHHLVGTALADGAFPFTLEVTDRGCSPFVTMTQPMAWNVARGVVTIVDATPGVIPVAAYNDPQKYPDVDALDTTVYGNFTSISFIVAGGVGPYTCAIVDDPADPDDDNGLPFGPVMPPNSCSIVGKPEQVGPGGRPFRFTLRATDSVGQQTFRKFQWKIDTPPMIVGSTSLANGVVGVAYGDAIQIVDGVPPFTFEWTSDIPSDLDNVGPAWIYAPPAAPTFPSLTNFTVSTTGEATNKLSAADYPAPAAPGPYYPAPPEGLYITETGGQAGSIAGAPRRYGTFTVNVHAYSSTVPNERGQHAFAQFTFPVAQGPALIMQDSFLVDGDGSNSFLANTADGVGTLPEFEVLQPKQIQMVATGGAPYDGWNDAPHKAQRTLNLGEVDGTYDWEVTNWDSRAQGWHPANSPAGRPTGIADDVTGLLQTTNGGTDLVRQGRQVIEVTVKDQRLPIQQTQVHEMALSVGPDVVIITDSNQSAVITTGSSYDSTAHNDSMFIKKMQIINNTAQKSPLDDSDLPATHIVPAAANLNALSNPLGRLLSGVGKTSYSGSGRDGSGSDLMRVVVAATGWWNDTFHLNPRGARAFQHGDAGKAYYEYYANEYYNYGSNPDTTAVSLPDITDGSVTANLGTGVYTNGGKLYAFENDTHFGVFIIREEGKVYVPFAMQKGTWTGFGDYCQAPLQGTGANAPTDSQMRMVHMTVSPNGRFAAMKIKASPTNMTETVSQSRVVLIDLAGQKVFGGETYRLVSAASASGYLMADALTLTNEHLYCLVSAISLNYPYGWLAHNVMRESILGGSGTASFAPGLPSNASGQYLSLPYHNTPTQYLSSSWNSTTVYTTYYAYAGGSSVNRAENDTAPIPFRVSADGTSCAIMCGPYDGALSGATPFMFRPYVDRNGAGFVVASSTNRRAPYGAARAHRLRFGPAYYGYAGLAQWGKHEGPSGGFEISDDGTRIAYSVSAATTVRNSASYYSSYQAYYYMEWASTRMDVVAAITTTNWATFTERQVTSSMFGGSHKWRFGGLAFSRDGDRLFFFGGMSQKDAGGSTDYAYWTTSIYNASAWVTGTYYLFEFSSPAQVRSVVPTNAGGTGSNTYSASSPFNPTAATLSANWGVVAPFGGFWSQNGSFLYIDTAHPMSSSDGTCHRLIGINTTAATINGKLGKAGFAVGNWPSVRGFLPAVSTPGLYYGGMLTYLGPGAVHVLARMKMAKNTGVVFFGSHTARYSGNPSTSYGVAYTQNYQSSYAKDNGNIECFASNVGGDIQRLTFFSNDGSVNSPRGRSISMIEVNDAGDRVAFIWNNGSSGGPSEYYNYQNNEGIGYVAGIQMNPATGALLDATQTILEGTEGTAGAVGSGTGRAGCSMAFGTDGQRVYYSFGPGATNENQRKIAAPRIDGAGDVDATTTVRHGSGARESVLHAGR
jgi:hypothetical protein